MVAQAAAIFFSLCSLRQTRGRWHINIVVFAVDCSYNGIAVAQLCLSTAKLRNIAVKC